MDRFSPEKILGEIFWDEPLLLANQTNSTVQSAFVQYRDLSVIKFNASSKSKNMNGKMLAFLRKSWPAERNKVAEYEKERSFRHMINERMRRHRQRQCCLALHSMLPHGTKTDNNSVIQMATKEIQRLQGCRQELQKANFVLETNNLDQFEAGEGSNVEYLRIMSNPTSGIDSMVETLQCLKTQGVDTRRIKSNFSPQELFAVLEIETEVVYACV